MAKKTPLARIRRYMTTNISLYLYNSLIAPCFSFNDFIYDPMTQCDENKLQVMQNACLRVCLQKDRLTHRSDLFAESKVVPLDVQRKLHTCEVVYKGINGKSTPFVNNAFSRVSDMSEWGHEIKHTK